jgi:DNA-binding transcriptional MocR family regulator
MTIAAEEIRAHPGPVYRALAEALADAIGDGRLPAGEKLPPQRELAWKLDVTVGTVGRAYDMLAQRGLVRGEVGRGTYVLGQQPALGAHSAVSEGAAGAIDLATNRPTRNAAIERGQQDLQRGFANGTLGMDIDRYPPIRGLPRHRAAMAEWLSSLGVPSEADNLVVTSGVQAALAASLSAIARPGDAVMMESLTYGGIRSLAARLGLRAEPVALDQEGVLPESVLAARRHSGARVLIISPSIHNPTAGGMSLARRQALADLASEHDLLLVEDDVYGPLVADRPAALADLVPDRTIHLCGISKFLAPGLRLGMVRAPRELADAIAAAQVDLSLGPPTIAAGFFEQALASGLIGDAIAIQQEEARARQAIAARQFAGFKFHGQPTALHIWLHLPECWSSAEFAMAALRAGMLVAPAEKFLAGRGGAPSAARISLSTVGSRAELETVLGRLASLLRAGTATDIPVI